MKKSWAILNAHLRLGILTHFDTSKLIYMIFSSNANLQQGIGSEKVS